MIDILLVEDNIADAELTIRALKKNKAEISLLHLQNGKEALDYIFCKGTYNNRNIAEIPKLILLDLKMPKVDGLEVLRQIKSDERTKLIPIVMLTSSKEYQDILGSYRLGANSYLVKPVDFGAYMETVAGISHYWLELNEFPV